MGPSETSENAAEGSSLSNISKTWPKTARHKKYLKQMSLPAYNHI